MSALGGAEKVAGTGARAPYFVLAHHRSGSNFLNDLLQAHPRIECINEPFSMHTGHFRECDLAPWSSADFDPELLHASLAGQEALRGYLIDFREYLCQSNSARVIGFKDTVLFGKLGWLKAFMPSLKIIFLRRDPRSIVSSLLDFWNYAELVRPAFEGMHPDYRSAAIDADRAIASAEMAAMSIVVRYELARRTLDAFEHRTLHLEALMRRPHECLEELAGFLGLEANDTQLSAQFSFLEARQAATRGGVFSSFRTPADVENRWKQHLQPPQVRVIEDVLRAADVEWTGESV